MNPDFKEKTYIEKQYSLGQKLKVFLSGLWFILKHDLSVTFKLSISFGTLLIAIFLNQYINSIIILIVTGNMLSMEIMNTCIELLCDYIKTEYDEKIKAIKDVSAVASGVSILVWLGAVFYELYEFILIFSS